VLNGRSQRRTKSLFVWFYVKEFTDLNQTNPTNYFNKHMHKHKYEMI